MLELGDELFNQMVEVSVVFGCHSEISDLFRKTDPSHVAVSELVESDNDFFPDSFGFVLSG